jgi:hypothetical protein
MKRMLIASSIHIKGICLTQHWQLVNRLLLYGKLKIKHLLSRE